MRAVELTDRQISRIEKHLDPAEYVELMEDLAAWAARILSGEASAGAGYHVITSVDDFDLLAIPIIKELEKREMSAVWSCVWPERTSIGLDRRTTIAPIVVSVDEAPLDARKHLILVSSCVDTTAVLESMLTHAHSSPHFEYGQISVVAPFFAEGVRREFKQALPRRNLETYRWLGYFQVSHEAALRLKGIFTQVTAQALGVDNPEDLRRHMPKKILTRFDDTPKSTPGMSM